MEQKLSIRINKNAGWMHWSRVEITRIIHTWQNKAQSAHYLGPVEPRSSTDGTQSAT